MHRLVINTVGSSVKNSIKGSLIHSFNFPNNCLSWDEQQQTNSPDLSLSPLWCRQQMPPHLMTEEPQRLGRERWPLLTVENEVNGDSKRTNERGPSLFGSLGLSCWYKRFLFCLGCSSQPSTKYFIPLLYTISIPWSPSPSKLGRHSCWVACLLVCVSLWGTVGKPRQFV
jgi:hypothetical protein